MRITAEQPGYGCISSLVHHDKYESSDARKSHAGLVQDIRDARLADVFGRSEENDQEESATE